MSVEQQLNEFVRKQHAEATAQMVASLTDAQIPQQYHGILKTMMRQFMGLALVQREEQLAFFKTLVGS